MPRLTLAQIGALSIGILSAAYPLRVDANQDYPTKIIATPTSPVTLTSCATFTDPGNFTDITNNAVNRSTIFLTSYVVRWYAYDHSGVGIRQGDLTYTFASDLAPNDTTSGSEGAYFITEPLSALASMACRMESAKFEGGRSWTYGRPWHGQLAPPSHQKSSDSSNSGELLATSPSPGHVEAIVRNTWNDTVNGNLFVHVAIDVKAGDVEATFGRRNVTLTMDLIGGTKRTYQPMTGAAPSYQKLDAVRQNSTTKVAFEVDPKEDLGAIGSLQLLANTKARVVATFEVGADTVTNANDNRHIVFH